MKDKEIEDFKYFLVTLDLKTLTLILKNIEDTGSKMNNIFNIDNEKTLYQTKGYLNCLEDLSKTLKGYIHAKEIGVDKFLDN